MSTLIVIPARLGATRLPQKPLRLLGGLPLIVRVWERVAKMNIADRVVVATDSERVAIIAREAGAEVVMTRADHPSGTDRVAEVALKPEFSGHDVIVNVQGDEPYVSKAGVQGAAAFVAEGIYPLGTAAFLASPAVLGDPAVVKVVTDSQNRALYFSRAPIPFLRDRADAASRNALVKQHVGVYAYTQPALARWVSLPRHPLELTEQLEQLRAVADGLAMGVATVEPTEGGGIDTEEDLALANARWREKAPTPAGAR
ncbi:MAG TPA: 3-deoxy-manno-octulosonate cytidylyltransferase [Gemmatimonadaceae bacterium]|nr:3-deoxy-manno-octulosonate cytidylyltransferase [Gemmatimonadaceae bacterium]